MAGGGVSWRSLRSLLRHFFVRPAGDFRLIALIAMSVLGYISTKVKRKGKANCTVYQ